MLGTLIKIERLAQNISQSNLCKNICTASYLSKIENENAICDNEIYEKLFSALNIEDEIYIENFYNRLLDRTDPLTLYFKKQNEYKMPKNNNLNNTKKYNNGKMKIKYILYIIMMIGLIGAVIYFELMR